MRSLGRCQPIFLIKPYGRSDCAFSRIRVLNGEMARLWVKTALHQIDEAEEFMPVSAEQAKYLRGVGCSIGTSFLLPPVPCCLRRIAVFATLSIDIHSLVRQHVHHLLVARRKTEFNVTTLGITNTWKNTFPILGRVPEEANGSLKRRENDSVTKT